LKIKDRFSKNTQISNFIKIRLTGAEKFHAECLVDGHEANSRFWQSCGGAQRPRSISYPDQHTCIYSC